MSAYQQCPRCKTWTEIAPDAPLADTHCEPCAAYLATKRAAASKGGKTTAARYDMAELGRRGFESLVARLGDRGQAVAYLQSLRGMPRPSDYRPPRHPKNEYGEPTGRTIIAGEH